MHYSEALEYLSGRLRLGVKLGNERFEALLLRLGGPQHRLRVIHIAGTKGKGSTTAMAASILQAAGYSVGQYLSPYVYDVRERIQKNGTMIPEHDFARWVTTIKPHIEALENTELGAITEFELKTAIALCWFVEQDVDYAVLEVGLGGRLDATNVVANPLVTAITNIGLDHTELLGDTLAKIAYEKAGIVKPMVPCVTAVPRASEAFDVISEVCRAKCAPFVPLAADDFAAPGGRLTLRTPRRILSDVTLRLHGSFQHGNAAVALNALDAIDEAYLPAISDAEVRAGLRDAWLPGRMQQICGQPAVVLDVAHNELAAEALAEALIEDYGANQRRVILVVGLSRQHQPLQFLKPLLTLNPAIVIATQPSFRPQDAQNVANAAEEIGITQTLVIPSVDSAIRHALSLATPGDLICLTGSFYTVGDLTPELWEQMAADNAL